MTTDAYPLKWPDGWKRTESHRRRRAKFSKTAWKGNSWEAGSHKIKGDLTIADGAKRIAAELKTMGVNEGQWVISSNLELRNDGMPRSSQRIPDDPRIAVYWTRKGKQQVMAIDLYDRVADNLAAVAASLGALRTVERHGGAQVLDRAFTGFTALANPDTFDPYSTMGLLRQHGPFTRDQVNARFRDLSRIYHPESGHERASQEEFQKLVNARGILLKEIDNGR